MYQQKEEDNKKKKVNTKQGKNENIAEIQLDINSQYLDDS